MPPGRRRGRSARLLAAALLVGSTAVACSGGGAGSDAAGSSQPASVAEVTREPTTTAAPTTTSSTVPPCTASGAVAAWPLRRRLAQLLMPALPERAPQAAAAMVGLFQPGGVFLTTGSVAADGTLPELLAGADPVPPFVAIDEEGGRVQRLAASVGALPSARQSAATLGTEEVRAGAERLGRRLLALGIDVDLAPVVDLSSAADDTVIGDRSFSADPAVATRYASAFAAGLRDAGVLPVLKHYPGHGRASGDSHRGPVTTPSFEELRRVDLVPYETLLAEQPVAVMVGHLDVPGLTEPGLPASVSPAALRYLREDLGFDGLVLTDDFGSMAAITARFSVPDAAVRAVSAGVDLVLWNNADIAPVVSALEQAVRAGTLPEARVDQSVERILTAKGVDPCEIQLPRSAQAHP